MPAVDTSRRLDRDETTEFWDQRHRKRGALASGGDVSADDATNAMFYALRIGRLIDIVGTAADLTAPRHLLDAGCGKGIFSRAMAEVGHRVDGIDVSSHAVELCQSRAGRRERYTLCSLEAWRPPYLYDTVYSIDVLYHVMDDALWEAAVRNLASLVRFGGQLVLVDHDDEEDRDHGTYQRSRGKPRYQTLVEPLGFRREGFVNYEFRHTPAGLHVWTRVA